jgi:hypothetical protein
VKEIASSTSSAQPVDLDNNAVPRFESRRVRIEGRTALIVLIFCLLVGLFIYRQFPALTSATDYASRVRAAENRSADTLDSEAGSDLARAEANRVSGSAAVLQKLREEERLLEEDALREGQEEESKGKEGLRLNDILDLVNEDPDRRFEERVRKQDREEAEGKPKAKGIEKNQGRP